MKCIKKNDMTKFFIFKQKTTYEMRISEWSSNVCSSDLQGIDRLRRDRRSAGRQGELCRDAPAPPSGGQRIGLAVRSASPGRQRRRRNLLPRVHPRSEEHTSELQSLMRISYAVFCLKKKTTESNYSTSNRQTNTINTNTT